jgi:hypothetical protein
MQGKSGGVRGAVENWIGCIRREHTWSKEHRRHVAARTEKKQQGGRQYSGCHIVYVLSLFMGWFIEQASGRG